MSIEEIEKLYINMENELLMNIANKLARGKPMEIDKWDLNKNAPIEGSGGVNEWQLERLKELGELNEENAKIIAKYSGQTIEKVEQVFNRAREIGTEVDKDILELGIKAGILNEINPILENTAVKSILKNAINTTLTTFNSQNKSLLASSGNNYRQIVNEVSTEVLAGTKTTMTAMQEAVSRLADKGLTGFTAINGAKWSPEAYTKMVLRANTKNTINQIQEERLKLSGNDYIEISQHIGARPLCSQDQGQIFSLSGNTENIEDGNGKNIKVRSWSSSTYGKPAGILGINCGHSRYAFVPGISIFRSEPIPKEENDKVYQEKQQQRLYERTIRNKKREIEMLKVTGADENYIRQRRRQLSDYIKQYLDFLDNTSRTRITANEWIGNITLSFKTEETNIPKYQMENNKRHMSDKEIKTMANKINNIINKHVNTESKWSEKIVVDNSKNPGKLWSCDIRIGNNTLEQELSHELLHARSISYFNEDIFLKYMYEEEATVEMLNKQILIKEKIPYYTNGYANMVSCLEEISDIIGKDKYKFSKELFNVKVTEREKWLKKQIKDNPEKDKLEELLKEAFVKW